jgi:Zn-dependent peptidase ImmA (M78 family)
MSILGKSKGRAISRIQFNVILKRFLIYLKRELRLRYDIPIVIIDDVDYASHMRTFGHISKDNVIHLSIINRHPVDILRTISHEYVHYKQHIEKGIEKNTKAGSPSENEANAKAGEIIRKYCESHPELFNYMSIR